MGKRQCKTAQIWPFSAFLKWGLAITKVNALIPEESGQLLGGCQAIVLPCPVGGDGERKMERVGWEAE